MCTVLFVKTTENAIYKYVVYVLPYLCKQPYSMPAESGLTGGRNID